MTWVRIRTQTRQQPAARCRMRVDAKPLCVTGFVPDFVPDSLMINRLLNMELFHMFRT